MFRSIIKLNRPLVLATASEARRRLVFDLGLKFLTDVVEIDETPRENEAISDYVKRLAVEKANKVVPPSLDAIIVAVDTAIGIDGRIIGKPKDEKEARRILEELSGRAHEVKSAIAVRDMKSSTLKTEVTCTSVEFIELSGDIVNWYISTGEWKNRAGAYAIQDKGMALVKEIRGCLTNVIGISIPSLMNQLSAISGQLKADS